MKKSQMDATMIAELEKALVDVNKHSILFALSVSIVNIFISWDLFWPISIGPIVAILIGAVIMRYVFYYFMRYYITKKVTKTYMLAKLKKK